MAEFCPFCRFYRIGMNQLNPRCQRCRKRVHCASCDCLLSKDGSCPAPSCDARVFEDADNLFGIEDDEILKKLGDD